MFQQILTKSFLKKEYLTNKNSACKIAKKTECNFMTIFRYLKKHKIKIRTHKEASKGINKNNRNRFIDGRSLKKYYCKDCGKKISWQTALEGEGRCRSCAMKELCKNPENHPGYKGGKPKCMDCGKRVSRYDAIRCLKCAFKLRFGKNNPNWKDGASFEPYSSEFSDKLKQKIRKRDNYQCQNCDITEEEHLIIYGFNLPVHHIDYDKVNCKEGNLITLCLQCNSRANGNRNYWKNYYRKKVNGILFKT